MKNKEYQKASYFYQKGILYLDYTIADTKEEDEKFDEETHFTHLNLALAKFKLN